MLQCTACSQCSGKALTVVHLSGEAPQERHRWYGSSVGCVLRWSAATHTSLQCCPPLMTESCLLLFSTRHRRVPFYRKRLQAKSLNKFKTNFEKKKLRPVQKTDVSSHLCLSLLIFLSLSLSLSSHLCLSLFMSISVFLSLSLSLSPLCLALKNAPVCTFKTLPCVRSRRPCHIHSGAF